ISTPSTHIQRKSAAGVVSNDGDKSKGRLVSISGSCIEIQDKEHFKILLKTSGTEDPKSYKKRKRGTPPKLCSHWTHFSKQCHRHNLQIAPKGHDLKMTDRTVPNI
ncbi:hypothetical protein M8C21_007551, partial [Ambrosia artemisiifolia]